MTFLLANWRLLGIAVIILSIGGYLGITKYQLSSCRTANLELQLSIAQQNNSIKRLAEAGQEATKKAAVELEKAQKAGIKYAEKAKALEGLKTSTDECKALKELIAEQRK